MGISMYDTKGDKVFKAVDIFLLIIITLLCAYPMWFVLIAAVSNPDLVQNGQVMFLPKDFTWDGYQAVFQNSDILIGYRNTIIYTVFGTLLDLVVTLPAAYALSRHDFVGRNIFTVIFTITMFFSGGMIPGYLVVQRMHLINNPLVMIIIGATGMYDIILCRTFFQSSIPSELTDAAQIDGCSNTQLFVKVILPLSKPIVAVMTLFFAISHWNNYFTAMLYLNKPDLRPLQLVLQEILIQSDMMAQLIQNQSVDPATAAKIERTKQLVRYASIVVSSLPVMCLYPLIQKYFVKGIMIGSIKG